MFFTILVFLAAISLESLGSYISVVGLASKGSIILIITAISFDFAKVVIASVLYKKWHSIHFLLKSFLVPSLIGLIIFTSVGAYGYLIQEFTKTTIGQEQGRTLITSMEEERGKLQSRKEAIDGQIAALPANSVLQRKRLTAVFAKELDHINTRLIELDKEIPEAKVKVVADTNSSGTLGSIAKAYNVEPDLIIRLLAFFMVLMIDPLAIILLTIGNFLVEQRKKEKLMPKPVIKYIEEPVAEPAIEEESIFKKAMNAVKKKENPVQEPVVEQAVVENKVMAVNSAVQEADIPVQKVAEPVQNVVKVDAEQSMTILENIQNSLEEKSVPQEKVIVKSEAPKKEIIEIPKVETLPISSIATFKRIPKKKKTGEAKVEAPVVEAKVEAPVVETKVETPVVEAKVEAPVVETKVETPVVEAKVETPIVETKVEAPVVEAKVETPVVEAKVETPIVETKVEAPVVETKVEAPVVEAKVEAPVVEAKVEAPVVKPVAQEVKPVVKAPILPMVKPVFEKPKMLDKVAPITVSSREEKNVHMLPKPPVKVSRTIEIPKPVLFDIKGGNIIKKPSVVISEQYSEQLAENEKKFVPSNLTEDKAVNFDSDENYWLDEEIVITEKDMIKGFETKNILDENFF